MAHVDEKSYYEADTGFSSGVDTGVVPMTEAEKERYLVDRKGSEIGEAAGLYGDVGTAEEMGYVRRALKSRHVQFIALGGTIGTGLFIGIGKALAGSGPLSVLLGYTITGMVLFAMMQSLGEMVTWLPLPGAIPQICHRYVDPAMGFAVGWNNWYNSALTQCAEISAAATVITYWHSVADLNPAIWISIIIVFIVCLNIFAVAIYGEAEFAFASIKLVTIVGLLICAFCLDLGAGPATGRLGFTYWKHPGAMVEVVSTGSTGRFLGFFNTLVNAAFSYGGVETVAVMAGEAENPRRNIPKAVRRVFWRILFFYSLGSLAIGVLVPYTNKNLDNPALGGTAASSPWVIGIQLAGVKALPSIINAVILTSAISSGNAFLYVGSRYLFALAQNGQAPKFLLKCNKAGVPWICVAITASFALLTYLSCGSSAIAVFNWFLNLTTIASLFTWISISVAYIRFHAHLKAQGVDRNTLVMKSPLQPYLAWISLIFFSIIVLFNGWEVFTTGGWSTTNFITAYIGIPIYFGLYIFWKIFKKTKWVKSTDADLWTGKAAIDAEVWPEEHPRNMLEKIWFWIA